MKNGDGRMDKFDGRELMGGWEDGRMKGWKLGAKGKLEGEVLYTGKNEGEIKRWGIREVSRRVTPSNVVNFMRLPSSHSLACSLPFNITEFDQRGKR